MRDLPQLMTNLIRWTKIHLRLFFYRLIQIRFPGWWRRRGRRYDGCIASTYSSKWQEQAHKRFSRINGFHTFCNRDLWCVLFTCLYSHATASSFYKDTEKSVSYKSPLFKKEGAVQNRIRAMLNKNMLFAHLDYGQVQVLCFLYHPPSIICREISACDLTLVYFCPSTYSRPKHIDNCWRTSAHRGGHWHWNYKAGRYGRGLITNDSYARFFTSLAFCVVTGWLLLPNGLGSLRDF